MNLDSLLSDYLNGEPLHDMVVIAILFTIMFEFYKVCFSSFFTIFKR